MGTNNIGLIGLVNMAGVAGVLRRGVACRANSLGDSSCLRLPYYLFTIDGHGSSSILCHRVAAVYLLSHNPRCNLNNLARDPAPMNANPHPSSLEECTVSS